MPGISALPSFRWKRSTWPLVTPSRLMHTSQTGRSVPFICRASLVLFFSKYNPRSYYGNCTIALQRIVAVWQNVLPGFERAWKPVAVVFVRQGASVSSGAPARSAIGLPPGTFPGPQTPDSPPPHATSPYCKTLSRSKLQSIPVLSYRATRSVP